MHDLICDVALAIASRDNNVFALKDEDVLKDWPNGETMEKCTMISLRYANISYFPKELKCPRLTFFFVGSKDSSVKIPTSFFMEMKNLEVLDLTKMHFSYLPSSISLLKNLRTLCLDQCVLGDITLIGELKNLEILSLLSSDIEMLPKEIGQLVKLKLLDLSDCTKLKIIPRGLLSSFSRLEELFMANSFVHWEVEGQVNASLAELKALSCLTTLNVHIFDAKIIPKDLFPAKLKRYKIFIGDQARDRFFKNECLRALNLKLNTSIHHLDPGIKRLLMNTEDLYLEEMKGAEIVLPEFHDWHCFRYLKNLHIQNGLEIQYIVDDHDAVDIIEFLQLRSLTLEDLPKLVSFCSENKPGSAFIPQHQLPLFSRKVAFPTLAKMNLSHLSNMKMIWHNHLSASSFCKLERMEVRHCDELLTIFPSTMLLGGTFQLLQSMSVSHCGSLEEVFELQMLNMEDPRVVVTQLRELYVFNLPKLKNVWNKDPQGILTFQNLNVVYVRACWSLKYVFPASIARVLPQLKDLTVDSCAVEEIVSKAEGWEMGVTNFEFDQVSSLVLWNLPKLKCFYPGMHTTKWPMLKKLKTYHCNKVKILDIGYLNLPEMNEDDHLESPIQPPLLLVEKVVPKLEEVSLTSDDIAIICDSKVSKGIFHEIKALYLECYHDESAIFPTIFLERFSNLEKLEVICCKFMDLFSSEGGFGKGTNAQTLLPIRNLRLNSLYYKKHIWTQGSRLDCNFPNLETLEVSNCGNLISLGLSSTPFQNLMTLDVRECEAMINLVTSLAVQSLVQLKNLRIKNCVSMKQIIGNEGDDEAASVIIFNRLKCLELGHLPSLKSFCSGNHTFGFPSLDQVIVSQCPELEIFCKGELNAPTLQRVQVTDKDEKGHWDGDLNSTIQQLFKKKVDYEAMEYLMLTEFSKAIEIWRDNLPKSLNLKNLKCLEVYECNSLTYVFTTSMVLDLVQLKQMQVRNCPMMEQIITNDGAEEAATNTIMFPSLQSISIVSCSNLRSFYLGSNTVECPYLTALGLVDCPKMVAFISSSPREQNIENIGIAPLFNDKEYP
ncbi:uncharacterized protein LOC111277604 [Durio zibethinus]|uniref:Uncharacterized protein LOC111277604 n=1 Tax=Durio zibethinus TaxID=66656 RepID=A0A6P5WW77_DURZI|nr:uncharacterized protein LOC111277604 [Durio zibethinus]